MDTEKLMDKGTLWFPEAVTTYAQEYDFLYNLIYYFSIFLLVSVFGTALYFAIKYRKTEKNQIAEKQVLENEKLEIIWTVIPLILVMVLFAWGFRSFIKQSVIPEDSIEIKVLGQKWSWVFFYPNNGGQASELVIPVNKNVKLVMYSKDVLHSFYIPNFRIKRDVIPGQYTTMWFNVDKVGKYQVFCAEYCGDGHSVMLTTIKVVEDAEYQKYLAEMASSSALPPSELGKKLYTSYGCNACHTLDGATSVGPSWKDAFGNERKIGGASVLADENYLRKSIVEPGADIVDGFVNSMPSFSYLSDKEIDGLIEFIKTLSDKGVGSGGSSEKGSDTKDKVGQADKVETTKTTVAQAKSTAVSGNAVNGQSVFAANGCSACHSIDGNPGVGPTWKGIYGAKENLVDGSSIVVDDEYIKESILEPGAKITEGYQNIMPPYQLSDSDIADLVAYMKSLK